MAARNGSFTGRRCASWHTSNARRRSGCGPGHGLRGLDDDAGLRAHALGQPGERLRLEDHHPAGQVERASDVRPVAGVAVEVGAGERDHERARAGCARGNAPPRPRSCGRAARPACRRPRRGSPAARPRCGPARAARAPSAARSRGCRLTSAGGGCNDADLHRPFASMEMDMRADILMRGGRGVGAAASASARWRPNVAASMFAPQTTRPTRCPASRSRSGPQRARRWRPPPPAPPPAWPRRTAAAWRARSASSSTSTSVVDVAAAELEAVGRGVGRAQAVGDGAHARRWPAASPAAKLRRMLSAPSGSTPNTQAARAGQLDRRRHPRAEAAAADGHDHRVEVRHLLHQLEAQGGRAQRGERALEGMHEGAALLGLDLLHARRRRVCTSSTSSTSAPSSRHRATRKGLAVFGITTLAVVPRTRAA